MAVSTIDPAGLNIGQIGGRRNILINSDFKISQRGDYTTASSITNGEFFVDRWYIDIAGINGTKQQTTGLDITGASVIGNGAKLVATSSAGSSYLGMRQKVENPTQFVGRTLTYSGYVRSNSSNARLATFISGTNQAVTSDPHTGDGTWQKLSVTFTMTGNPTSGWFIDAFIIGASYANVSITSGDYIEVAFLQMELGDVATPHEHRSVGEELALCQRYFQKLEATASYHVFAQGMTWNTGASDMAVGVSHPVTMRTTPTFSNSGVSGLGIDPGNKTVSALSLYKHHANATFLNATAASGFSSGTAIQLIDRDASPTASLSFDAEL